MLSKLSTFLKPISFPILLMIIFAGCEKDELRETKEDKLTINHPKIVYYSELSTPEDVARSLRMALIGVSERSSDNLQTPFGRVRTDEVMQTVSSNGIENFTYRITNNDGDPKTFYNLIIKKNLDGSFNDPYVKQYIMSEEFYAAWRSGSASMANFVGKYQNHPLNGNNIDLDPGSRTSGPRCPPVPIDDGEPNDTTDDPSDPVDSGGSGGGGSTGGDPDGGGPSSGGNNSVTCSASIYVIVCNGGLEHESRDDPNCTANVKASTYLRVSCSDGSITDTQIYRTRAMSTSGDCPEDEGDVGVMGEITDPCQKLNALLQNARFKDALQDIKDNADGDDERGYEISENDGQIPEPNFVQGGSNSIELKFGGHIIAHMHNHTDFGNAMFSGEDIRNLFLLYAKNDDRTNGNGLNPGEVSSILVSEWGTFAIGINDYNGLSQLLGHRDIGFKSLRTELYNTYNNPLVIDNQAKYTGGMLNVIKDLFADNNLEIKDAISLYELNEDGTAFERITLNSAGEPRTNPCN